MCGICGLWNLNGSLVDPKLLGEMRDIMSHRGPDGYGAVLLSSKSQAERMEPVQFKDIHELSALSLKPSSYSLGLGHRRLSIIDLNTGDQPMCNEDGSIWIVYNGEIYNYRELRQELLRRGHAFKSSSDTEVIIHAYEEYGEECPTRFNGIFAFAIWDARRQLLFLARDHFGVKPLYYYKHNDRFYFSSEIKAILCDPSVPREIDLDALNLCLTFRYTPSPWTLFKDVYKLPPGCLLSVASQGIRTRQYQKESAAIDRKLTEEQWIEKLQDSVETAVARQMVSDVPIGLSLSSGVDSNTLLALMSQHSTGPVKAFTVGFAGRKGEIKPASESAKRFRAEFHKQVITSEDYSNFMQRYLWHLEEPIGNESAPAYYFVAKMAREQGVKVLINGQGTDESFAGYKRYLSVAYENWLKLATLPPLRWLIPHLLAGTGVGERYQRYLFTLEANGEADRFLRIYSIITDRMKAQLVQPDILRQVDPNLPRKCVEDQLAKAPQGTALERMTYVDARTSLPDNLLLCEDKMAMAASVEARVPYLDIELTKVAEQLPGKLKLSWLRDKYIHRKACTRWVGREISSRPQIGFENALDMWLRTHLGNQMQEIIKLPDSFTKAHLNYDSVLHLIQEHVAHKRDHQRILFLLLSIESWNKAFLRG